MLVNCPRCGFTQPQDKYCAQCGVDMETYRPPERSFIQKILGNPALQISLVLLIAGAVGLSLYQRRQNDLEDRVSYLKGGTQVVRSLSSPNDLHNESAEETLPSELLKESATDAPAADSAAPAEVKDISNSKSLTAADAAAGKKDKAVAPGTTMVSLVFAEMSLRGRDQIFEESSATGQFNPLGDYVAGIIPDLSRKLSLSNREIKILHREQRTIELQKPLQFFQGINAGNPETEIGFNYYVELTEVDAATGVFRGSVEVARSWSTSPNTPLLDKRQFPAVFELGRGSGFFMSGLMPRASQMANDVELVGHKPFEILRSNDFRSGNSEYFLFLEFTRN